MRLLVTGATGFIGSHLAEAAVKAGHEVVGTGLADRPLERRIAQHLTAQGVTVIPASLVDSAAMERALDGVTHVCHLGVAMREAGTDDRLFDTVNVQGTAELLKSSARAGAKRFVFCSTTGIYGHRVAGVVNERSPLNPGNVYEASKVRAEAALRETAPQLGIEQVILRPSDVYGPRDARLLKLFSGVSRGRFPLFGDGSGRRHMVYIADVVEAFMLACTDPRAADVDVILAGPDVTTLRALLDLLVGLFGRRSFGPRLPLAPMMTAAAVVEDMCTRLGIEPPIYRRRMDFYLSDAAYDVTQARSALGWVPRTTLRDGLQATIAGYRQDGDLPASG
jgi:nucleoside-diphosphate-sugar epimerase